MSKEITLQEAVISEVAFFDMFDAALGIDELKKYLYRFDRDASENDIGVAIRDLDGMVRLHRGLYCLKGRENLCDRRGEFERRSSALLRRVKRYCRFLRYVPFVRFVGVCNTVAFGAPASDSDIDLFIVAKNGRLFTARALVTFFFHLLGVRRHREKIARRFCLSFYVTQRGMDLHGVHLNRDDVYMYYWLRTMLPVLGDMSVYRGFLEINGIPERFRADRMLISGGRSNGFFEWFLSGYAGNFLEAALGRWQKKRALAKKIALSDDSGIVISDDMLKFHNIDRRKDYREQWRLRVARICSAGRQIDG